MINAYGQFHNMEVSSIKCVILVLLFAFFFNLPVVIGSKYSLKYHYNPIKHLVTLHSRKGMLFEDLREHVLCKSASTKKSLLNTANCLLELIWYIINI